jgi:hypothetical protein
MLEAVKARNEKAFLQTKGAIEREEKPTSGDAEKAKSLYEQGMSACKSQNFLTAVDLLTKAGAADPAHSRGATYLGRAQLKTNDDGCLPHACRPPLPRSSHTTNAGPVASSQGTPGHQQGNEGRRRTSRRRLTAMRNVYNRKIKNAVQA